MTVRSDTDVIGDSVEPLLEELLVEVVTGVRPESRANGGENITAALTEAAMVSFSHVVAQASEVERTLLAEALVPALTDLLAPALARSLAPGIVAALSRLAAPEEISEESEWDDDENSESSTRTNGSLGKGGRI